MAEQQENHFPDDGNVSHQIAPSNDHQITLCLHVAEKVDSASVLWTTESCRNSTSPVDPSKLQLTREHTSSHDGDIWSVSFPCSAVPSEILYHYQVVKKPSTLSLKNKELPDVAEKTWRTSHGTVEYDAFCLENNEHYSNNNLPLATISYIKWLFKKVVADNLQEFLTSIEKMKFDFPQVYIKTFLDWILRKSTDSNYVQSLYLSVVLGFLQVNNILNFQQSSKFKQSCDRILESLRYCPSSSRLPQKSLSALTRIAPILVNNSSSPGWLTFASCFYHHLGADNTLACQNKFAYKYESKEYLKLVDSLMQHLSRSDKQKSHKDTHKLLSKALYEAPDNETLLALYRNREFTKLFSSAELETQRLFAEIYQRNVENVYERMGNLPEALEEIAKLPAELQKQLEKPTSRMLSKFITFGNHSSAIDVNAFCYQVAKCNSLSKKETITVLHEVANSKTSQGHAILLFLLEDKDFRNDKWSKLGQEQHESILSKWIAADVKLDTKSGTKCKVTAAYKRAEQLMEVVNEDLIRKACVKAFQMPSLKVTIVSMLNALYEIEKLPTTIQDYYKENIRNMLQGELVKEVREAVLQFSKDGGWQSLSKLGEELLVFVLDIAGSEKPLDWSELWVTLLSAKGNVKTLYANMKFQAGKSSLQALVSSLTKKSVLISDFESIEKHKDCMSQIFALLEIERKKPQGVYKKEKKVCESLISKISNVIHDYHKKMKSVKLAIEYSQKISEGICMICDMPNVVEEFDKRYSAVNTVFQLESDDYWGPLSQVLKPSESLTHLVEITSFKSATLECLKEQFSSSQGGKDVTFLCFVTLLADAAVKRFKSEWSSVIAKSESLTVEKVKHLFGGCLDKRTLEKQVGFLQEYFKQFPKKFLQYVDGYVIYPSILMQVENSLAALHVFFFSDSKDRAVESLKSFQSCSSNESALTLNKLLVLIENVQKVLVVKEETKGVVKELGTSSDLVIFIAEIVDEDIRFLIDAVEEHSEQFVSESLVSDLIDVHSFLAPIMKDIKKNQLDFKAKDFFQILEQSLISQKNMATKIHQCSINVNSLKSLYTSVANREEVTKKIIANSLIRGVYSIDVSNEGVCQAKMTYVRSSKDRASYMLPDLHDLRSRAILISSSAQNKVKTLGTVSQLDINFSDFIQQVDLLTEITNLLSMLRLSGNINYYRKSWDNMRGTKILEEIKEKLDKDLEEWKVILSMARNRYYFLNYFRSDQLRVLRDFLTPNSQVNSEEVLSLFNFVDPNIKIEELYKLREQFMSTKSDDFDSDPNAVICLIGEVLNKIFVDTKPRVRKIHPKINDSPISLACQVQPGKLFIAKLEEKSPQTANVLLTLYANTSSAFPEPHQVLFCNTYTTWEEISLLLNRCFQSSKYLKRSDLFCIANVERLRNEIQFKLVYTLREHQHSEIVGLKSSSISQDYRLAVICCGGNHHHIVEHFPQYTHHVSGMSDSVLSECITSLWPDVTIITSNLPGLGKTEKVKADALQRQMNVVTFAVHGSVEPNKLIYRLKKLHLKPFHCLHIDINDVNEPSQLDTFVFHLIVIGMVSSGTQFYHLPTTHVYIEVANTLQDSLRDSLVMICKYFRHEELKWTNYANLLVSSEINSNTQVVCQYLHVHDQVGLDSKDISFADGNAPKPLPASRCCELLNKYYSNVPDLSFTVLNTFLAVLADQLRKFSESTYFKFAILKAMLGEEGHNVRTNLFLTLLLTSKEFASRSIIPYRAKLQSTALSMKEFTDAVNKSSSVGSAEKMVQRVKGMIHWEENNHLLVVFHGTDSQTITAVYRKKERVQNSVKALLTSQIVRKNDKNQELEDYSTMDEHQLKVKLERIASTEPLKGSENGLSSTYALTQDNTHKMILIILRVRVRVPVVLMGETGCGKTSLVKYLARTCHIPLSIFGFHAGIAEEKVTQFIINCEKEAVRSGKQMWVFLDEINTSSHLGLLSDIMCHHTLLGRSLSKNLVFLAACNPYELRPKEHIKTAGLEGKNVIDEYSQLVYRVHPLPETMIDYVWDYGSLTRKDEKAYIRRMVRTLNATHYERLLVELLAKSQQFIRETEKNHFCVSLRDVNRCIVLTNWFMDMMEKRKTLKHKKDSQHTPLAFKECRKISEKYNEVPVVKSIILALAHCYLSRLATAELRKSYRQCMMEILPLLYDNNKDGKPDPFSAIVRMEQEDYLDRMELPKGIAKNASLRENVFVMLVCILNHIPVFVIGKPGCSKSLSMQLIRSNLRGRDSKDPLFKTLPHLYVVSHQGSESSTSEGIIKVFEKARKYKSHNKDGNVLPVVLLDEVGLAENSKYNPLKVLHSLLEPGDEQLPDVAVVGISNWSLDAAKMNRAIHLSRPEPDVDDLHDTALCLQYARHNAGNINPQLIRSLAEAYFRYQPKQKHANFHGLRDYYSLIKSLTPNGGEALQRVNLALQRNFGGLSSDELSEIQKIFLCEVKKLLPSSTVDIIPIRDLIYKNLTDPVARHLMLLTSRNSAIGILEQTLTQLNKETIAIYGSRFDEDLSEDYNYRILSRIILCMERDCILILRDLESIYGSLYDMLNQNYAVVGKRKNCRVALGAHSNPMCQVNDGFRCIVLKDHCKLDYFDPPFFNRFEKQLLRFENALNVEQKKTLVHLQEWTQQISCTTVIGCESLFDEVDMFIGFHEDTLPSLVLYHGQESNKDALKKCKDDLMWIASPEGVIRASSSKLFGNNSYEVQRLSAEYFQKPIHLGFASFVTALIDNSFTFLAGDETGCKCVVMTYSNIHTNVLKCLNGTSISCQTERLSAYKSEKQLTQSVNLFWTQSNAKLLVLQCIPKIDAPNLLLARSIIENERSAYIQHCREKGLQQKKHVVIVIHVQRRGTTFQKVVPWQFSFLCGWKQVFLDVFETPSITLSKIHSGSIQHMLESSIWPLKKIAQEVLLWCFACINYKRQQRPLDSILHIVKNLFLSERVCRTVEHLVQYWLDKTDDTKNQEVGSSELWQVKVACDKQALINSSTLSSALESHVYRLVRIPLAKIIYFLEKENAWPPHILPRWKHDTLKSDYEELWCKLILKQSVFDMEEIPHPQGPGVYTINNTSLDLRLPFSHLVMKKIESVKELFLDDRKQLMSDEDNFDKNGELKQNVLSKQIQRFCEHISKPVPEIHDFSKQHCSSYNDDVLDVFSADFRNKLSREHRVSVVKAAFASHVQDQEQKKTAFIACMQLHSYLWVNKKEVLDQLRMIATCFPFVDDNLICMSVQDLSQHDDQIIASEETGAEGNGDDIFQQRDIEIEGKEQAEETQMEKILDNGSTINSISNELGKDELVEQNDEHDENEELKEVECFEEILVTKWCEAMLPSHESLKKRNCGLETWLQNTRLFILLASKVNDQSPAFHFLHLCTEFASIVLVPSILAQEEKASHLYQLAQIGASLEPRYLDDSRAFKEINDKVIVSLKCKTQAIKPKAFQRFLALFFGRCLDTNVDTYAVEEIIKRVLSVNQEDVVTMMSPVILRILMAEENSSEKIFVELLSQPDILKSIPNLEAIDRTMKELCSQDVLYNDSYAAAMVCDLIQSVLEHSMCNSTGEKTYKYILELNTDSAECEQLKIANDAVKILTGKGEALAGLQLLSAAAFLRTFFTSLSKDIAKRTSILTEQTQESTATPVLREINCMLSVKAVGHNRHSPVLIFLLKQLHHNMNLFELRKVCLTSKMFSSLQTAFDDDDESNKAEFLFFCQLKEYDEAEVAYSELANSKLDLEKIPMLAFLKQCESSSNHFLALMGILINKIYLKRAVRKLKNSEEKIALWFTTVFPQIPAKQLLKIIISENFHHSYLQLSPESRVNQVQLSCLILHISCVIASRVDSSNSPPSTLFKYLTNPRDSNYSLLYGETRIESIFGKHFKVQYQSIFTCTCGMRICNTNQADKNTCPDCQENYQFDQNKPIQNQQQKIDEAIGIPTWDMCTEHMSPFVFRALHLIVHATFYAGVALQFTTKDNLSFALDDKEGADPAEFCLEQVQYDLECLTTILNSREEDVIALMHHVVQRCQDLIRDSNAESLEWESEFTRHAENVLKEVRGTRRLLGENMRKRVKARNEAVPVEDQILELDDYPTQLDGQERQLKRLFRVTKVPTFEELRAHFAISPKAFQEKHSFLSLFFAKSDQLTIMSNLYHLLKWARYVSSILNHRVSRKEAQSRTIDDFLTGHLTGIDLKRSEKEKRCLNQEFDKFRKAWTATRQLVNAELSKEGKKMPQLVKGNHPIAYCIIDQSDYGIFFLTAVKILSSFQNEILDKLLFLSASQNLPALSFLKKSSHSSGVSSVSTQEAKEEDIISFKWSDKLLMLYAHNNPEYGKGEDIHYDIDLIEAELAKGLAFGKSYLILSWNNFIFSNEFIHLHGSLLSEIRELLPQSSTLPDDVNQGFISLKESRLKDVQDLLQHTEQLMFLLKRIQCRDAEMKLGSFAENWSSMHMLPSAFPVSKLPQPSSSIQLKHIVALYEELEDILADGALDGLHDKFKKEPLPDDIEDQIDVLIKRLENEQIPLRIFLKVLRRFVFRYFSSEKYEPKSHETLSACLGEPSLWPPAQKMPTDDFPDELTLEYLYSTIAYLQAKQRKKEGSDKKPLIRDRKRKTNVCSDNRRSGNYSSVF